MEEARLLTLEEAYEADIFFYETYASDHPDYGRVGEAIGNSVRIELIGRSWFSENAMDYGKGWRCWDKRPTSRQRKETEWED